jgi:4-hydroxy-tetrahydrodipicolinate reductase
MNKNQICLIGAAGRMGLAITEILSSHPTSLLNQAVEHSQFSHLGKDSGIHAGLSENKVFYTDKLEESIQKSDSVIDFGSSQNTSEVVNVCLKYQKPLVIGVTGLEQKTIEQIKVASLTIPILQSPNMSIGVNLLFKLVEIASKVLNDYDIEILDIHHRHKKDSPSGTARELKNVILKALSREEKNVIYGRHGNEYSERDKEEIAIHSMRAGEVVGDHTVHFLSAEERIEITHKAMNRRTFAVGAVKASEYLLSQKIGLYNMFDVLGI